MKFRYLIERGVPEKEYDEEAGAFVDAEFCVTTITPSDDTGSPLSTQFATPEKAKAYAEELHKSDGSDDPEDHPLKWKDPPKEWQPDAIAVSQYFDDGVEANRDA